jgi:hypothetical protein
MFQSISTNQASSVSNFAKQTLTKSPSLGTRCIKTTMLDQQTYPCVPGNAGYVAVSTSPDIWDALNSVNYNQTRISPNCDCYDKIQTCPKGASGPTPSFDVTETQDVLYRLDGFNISDWYVSVIV